MEFSLDVDFHQKLKIISARIKGFDNYSQSVAMLVALNYLKSWQEVADKNLTTSKARYVKSLKINHSDVRRISIYLDDVDPLVEAIEKGANGFDMKPTFLSSSKARTTESGKTYLIIPFREKKDSFVDLLTDDTIEQVKNELVAQITNNGGFSKSISNQMNFSKIPSLGSEQIVQRNMIENEVNAVSNFRIVSTDSPATSWIHPGWKPRNFILEAVGNVDVDGLTEELTKEFVDSFSDED